MGRNGSAPWQGCIDRMSPLPVRAVRHHRSTEQRMKGGALPYCAPPVLPPLTLAPLPEGLEAAAASPVPVHIPRTDDGDWFDN